VRALAVLVAMVTFLAARPADARPPRWKGVPVPAALPKPDSEGDLAIDDFTLHYAVFGHGDPVVLLHGGLGNLEQFGNQVPALTGHYQVIAVDSRGHGRSTRSHHGIGYHQMAEDVVALLDHLKLARAAIVGWSDGGVTGLDLAIHHPDRVSRLFVIGTNYDLTGLKHASAATMTTYFARCKRDYARLSPAPRELAALRKELRTMWTTEPVYTAEQLAAITAPTLIVLGDHDEIVRRDHAEQLARLIPHGTFLLLRDASHFAMWQAPADFNAALLGFLAGK
jgi:pimeloyl-ACP methyl ester carboxylesterase